MVLKELYIRKVAIHNFLNGLFKNAYLKLEKISPKLLDKYFRFNGIRLLSSKVDLLLLLIKTIHPPMFFLQFLTISHSRNNQKKSKGKGLVSELHIYKHGDHRFRIIKKAIRCAISLIIL